MRRISELVLYTLSILAVACLTTMCCGGGGDNGQEEEDTRMANMSSKAKQLMKKRWQYDPAAVRIEAAKAAHNAQKGFIKNINEIKIGGDVGKGLDYLSAKSVYFGFGSGKNQNDLVYELTTGKGLLASKQTGFWELANGDTQLVMKGIKVGDKRVDRTYVITSLTENRMILHELKGGQKAAVPEIYIYGIEPTSTDAVPDAGSAATKAPATPAEEAPAATE